MTCKRYLYSAAASLLLVQAAHAQLDLLTVREAEQIVEAIPEVAAANRMGACPMLVVQNWGSAEYWVSVRRGCGLHAGQMVSVYTIDRWSGQARVGDTGPLASSTPEFQFVVDDTVRSARKRKLTIGEASCLARTAMSSALDAERFSLKIVLEPAIDDGDRIVRYTPLAYVDEHTSILSDEITVDLRSGRVVDATWGTELDGPSLAALRAAILQSRHSDGLSEMDALLLARTVKSVRSAMENPCVKTSAVDSWRSQEIVIGFTLHSHCEGQAVDIGTPILVNRNTGEVSDGATGRLLSATDTRILFEQMKTRMAEQAAARRKEISERCGSGAQ